MSAAPTTRTSTDPASAGWLALQGRLADLALGSSPSAAGVAAHLTQSRHLAFLPPEVLDLDLADPLQRDFGDYELQEKVGQGGMGVVYRARQKSLDREVAVKLLAAGPWASKDFIERFTREAQSAARMQHPNIVSIFEVGAHDELNYFSMQLVRGESLAALLSRAGPQDPRRAASLLRTVAEAVDYAHRLGVLHLDLKPGNVLLDERGEPQVADFGLARRLDDSLAADSDEVSGTPSYMAPEQATLKSKKLTPATDVYGLGAILYELLCGRPPFLGATAHETLQRVVKDDPESLRRLAPHVSADLAAITGKCLAKDPVERYPSAGALAADLIRFLEDRPVSVRPLSAIQRLVRAARREPRIAALASLFALALIGGLFATGTQWRRAEHSTVAVRDLLWTQRLDAAMRHASQREPFAALPLLAANIAEAEAAGDLDEAARDRARIGTLLANSPRLIAAHHLAVGIRSVAIAPGGDAIAIGTLERVGDDARAAVVRLLDRVTGRERWRLELGGHSHFLAHVSPGADYLQFTADGRRLLVQRMLVDVLPQPHGMDMLLVDTATGGLLMPPAPVFADFRDASFSPDGEYALLRGTAGQMQAFRVDGWQPLGAPVDPGGGIWIASPHGRHAAQVGDLNLVGLYSMRDLHRVWEIPLDAGVSAWTFDPAGTTLALGLVNGQVIVVDCEARTLRGLSPSPSAGVRSVQFAAGGAALVAVSRDGTMMQWLLPAGSLRHQAIRESAEFSGAAIDAAGELLAGIGADEWGIGKPSSIHLWRAPASASEESAAIPLGRITTGERWRQRPLAVDGTSGLIAVGTGSGTLSIWRVPQPVERSSPAAPLPDAALDFDGQRLVDVVGNRVQVVDAADGHALAPPIVLGQPVGYAALSGSNDVLLVATGRRLHRFRATDSASLGESIELPNTPQRLALTHDGQLVVASWFEYREGHLKEIVGAIDLAHGRALAHTIMLPGPQGGITLDRNGRTLIAWRGAAINVFELPSLRSPYKPIDFERTPTSGPGAARTEAPRDHSTVEYFDVVAGGDQLVASRVFRFDDGRDEASLCRARLADGATSGCTALPSAWHRLAADPDLRVTATSTDRILHADGSMIAYGEGDGTTRGAIAMSGDGGSLVRVVRGGIELFDTATGERLSPLLPSALAPGDEVAQLAFAPNGERIAGRSIAGRWLVWETPIERRPVATIAGDAALLEFTELGASLPPETAQRLARADPGAPPRQGPNPAAHAVRRIDGVGVSPRSAEAPVTTLDLTAFYNIGLAPQHLHDTFVGWKLVIRPDGVHRLLGVDYDIRGAIALDSAQGPYSRSIRLPLPHSNLAALHLLAAAPTTRRDRQALPYLWATLHYRDGSSARHAFLYQRDLTLDWDDDGDANGTQGPPWTAWTNFPTDHTSHLALPSALSALRVDNPHPERAVAAVEFAAETAEWPSPWILAVSVETAAGTVPTALERAP